MERKAATKIEKFFRENYGYFFAALSVLVLWVFMLVVDRVYPFGEYTVASYDLSAQICPYIEHLFDVLDGKSTLFYSYSIVGGADVFGGLIYFIVSPFSFLFLLFGDGRVAEAAALVLPVKLVSISLAGTWFAKKFFHIHEGICGAIGIVYAYCGYTFVANTYINWLDFLLYAPFAVWAFVRFVQTEKYLTFSLFLAAFIYTCFSIACFSMLTVYPVLVAYAFFCVEKGKRKRFVAYLSLSFVVGVAISLPVLLPALASYLRAARAGNLFAEIYYGFTGEGFDAAVFFNRYVASLEAKWSYILSDAAFFTLTVFYFIRRGLRSGFSKFMLVAGVYLLLPTVVDESMLLLNMGSYFSYALRFGFLNAVYVLGGACLALDGLDLFKEKAPAALGEPLPAKKKNSATLWYILVCGLLIAALAFCLAGDFHKVMWDFLTSDENMREVFRSFASRFAHSIGGIATIAPLFFVVAGVLAAGILLAAKKKVANRVVTWVVLFVVAVQTIFFNEQLVAGNLSAQNLVNAEYAKLTATLDEREDGYFRIRDYNDALSANAPFTGGGNAFTVFSSMVDADNMTTATLFGFATNGKNTFKGNGGCAFGESFLGYKYILATEEGKTIANARSYWKKVLVDENGEFSPLTSETFSVYENELVFPNGYWLESGEFRFPKENTWDNSNENQNALYEFLSGKELTGNITTSKIRTLSLSLWKRAATVEVGAGRITASITAEEDGYVFLNFVASKGYRALVNGKETNLTENDLHFLCVKVEKGENVVEFIYESPYPMYALSGVLIALTVLLAVWFVTKKTAVFEKMERAIFAAGVVLSVGVTAFFFLFPTGLWLVKLFAALFAL
ncbi:MAG: YfhO family protein [Clostridia bacterium]|nr:YfhO family protein [Clostridia bacterium]